jgi:hypothetical protein
MQRPTPAVGAACGTAVVLACTASFLPLQASPSDCGLPHLLLCFTRAPEQWQAGKLTNRVDIWAWGCLMIQLLTGQPPWVGLNMYQVLSLSLRLGL